MPYPLHHRATCGLGYVDAAYYYTDRVARSVCLLVCHTSEPCKTAELLEMLFGLWTRVGPKNHVLDGVQISHETGQF